MTKISLDEVLLGASIEVLEMMFFADVTLIENANPAHIDGLGCVLACSGAQNGSFSVAIDRAALNNLAEAFYGDDAPPSTIKNLELLCELTNMLAGSTLSVYAPEHFCTLSSPRLCDVAEHFKSTESDRPDMQNTTVYLSIDGGVLSVSSSLRLPA